MQGYVDFFNEEKKYGFIIDQYGDKRFFHLSNCSKGFNPLHRQKVKFSADSNMKGLLAVNVGAAMRSDYDEYDNYINKYNQKAGCERAIQKIANNHINNVLSLRAKESYENEELISTNISLSYSPSTELKALVDDIKSFHTKMQNVIVDTAVNLETKRYQKLKADIMSRHLSKAEITDACSLIEADEQINISCQTVKLTVDLFQNQNRVILKELENGVDKNIKTERNLLFANAILIVEMTDFVIDYIENFAINGLDEINDIKTKINRKIEDQIQREETLSAKLETSDIDDKTRKMILKDIENRRSAISEAKKEWDNYSNSISTIENYVDPLQEKIETLRLIRDNANNQLKVLELISMVEILNNNLNLIDSAISSLKEFKLASLTPERVTRLLGYR